MLLDPDTPEGAAWIADHGPIAPHYCEICDDEFTDKADLVPGRSAYMCWECHERNPEEDRFDPRAEFGTYHVRGGSVVG